MHHNHTGHRYAVGYRPVTRSPWLSTVVGIACYGIALGASLAVALPMLNHLVRAVWK